MKFASANFYLNLSLKAKDFTRAKREFHLASARFHISPKAKYFTAMPAGRRHFEAQGKEQAKLAGLPKATVFAPLRSAT